MSKLDALLSERAGRAQSFSKVQALAKQSADGSLTSFAGLFKVGELSEKEKSFLEAILLQYKEETCDLQKDLESLISITSEVKAIHNQAALLHGERIKRVQAILKPYRDGAFTAWLYAAYGNRQTPYNFLLYFEFCSALPHDLKTKADTMPRQIIYALASREAPPEKKLAFVRDYAGQNKREALEFIRASFPIRENDKRRSNNGDQILNQIISALNSYRRAQNQIDQEKRTEIKRVLKRFLSALES
jgi:hypothetical protein